MTSTTLLHSGPDVEDQDTNNRSDSRNEGLNNTTNQHFNMYSMVLSFIEGSWSEGDRVTMMTLMIILSIQLCPLLGKEFDQSGKLLNPAPNDWMKNNTLHIKLFVAHSSYE